MSLSYPIGTNLKCAVSSPIGSAPNIYYARHEVSSHPDWGHKWQETHELVLRTAYLPRSWKTFSGAWNANEDRIGSGHAEIIPLSEGNFKVAISYFRIVRKGREKISTNILIAERLNAPLKPPRNVTQSFTPFGLFQLLSSKGMETSERADPERPSFLLADE
jgi:hypothetical protein